MCKLIFSIMILLVNSTAVSFKLSGQSGSKFQDYSIAYNIHVPDTTKDDWEILIMNIDGTDKRNITNHPDVAWTYFTFRDKIFFISDRDTSYRHYYLYTMDKNGNNIQKISSLRLEDSWMSCRNDGSELIVSGRIGKEIRHQLFLINLQSGIHRQITNDTGALYRDPCFSPDGKQIVFSYKKNKRDRSAFEELYIMNYDGTGLKQLTHYPADNISASGFGYKAGAAKWHPTQNFISYVSKQDGRNSIFAVKPDGSAQWKLSDTSNGEGWHDWSPDGQWLTYSGSDPDENQYHIMLLNWKTKELKQLTDNSYKSQLAPVFVLKNL